MGDRRRIWLYGLVPLAIAAALVGMYFSGVGWLQALAAPRGQREYGLVENLQNVLVIAIAVLCLRAAKVEGGPRARLAWRAIAAFAVFVLMEEIDWGDHYMRSLGLRTREAGEHFNIHNQGDLTDWIKKVVDGTLLLAFGVLPWVAGRLPERVRPWVPDRHSLLTLLVAVAASRAAHALEDAGRANNGSLHSNISEFREVFTYWLALLYLGELARRRAAAAAAAS